MQDYFWIYSRIGVDRYYLQTQVGRYYLQIPVDR